MNTDRELLELAAKAVGIKLHWEERPTYAWYVAEDGEAAWDPRSDGIQALYLAGALNIRIEPSPRGCSVLWPVEKGQRVLTVLCSVTGLSPPEAACLAIVRAAAEIARATQGAAPATGENHAG